MQEIGNLCKSTVTNQYLSTSYDVSEMFHDCCCCKTRRSKDACETRISVLGP